MITLAPGLRVYLACGVTDMRKGMVGLAMLVQLSLGEDPFGGAVFAFRGRRAGLIKLIWHDGVGLCMLSKRLECEFACNTDPLMECAPEGGQDQATVLTVCRAC